MNAALMRYSRSSQKDQDLDDFLLDGTPLASLFLNGGAESALGRMREVSVREEDFEGNKGRVIRWKSSGREFAMKVDEKNLPVLYEVKPIGRDENQRSLDKFTVREPKEPVADDSFKFVAPKDWDEAGFLSLPAIGSATPDFEVKDRAESTSGKIVESMRTFSLDRVKAALEKVSKK